ncbi:MAG: DUF2878 family protein [Candidatus Aenigmarchaeota archaeon]|nr:DUF2878 family protein [Candidatus Aenigmarchaeota archaeon]
MKEKELLLEILIFCISIAAISFLYADNVILTAFFIVISALFFRFWYRENDLRLYLLAAVLGSLTEAISIYNGAWQYTNPTFFIPAWLPFAWGLAVVMIRKIVDTIT